MNGNYGDRGGFRSQRMTPPVEVGEEIDVTIEAVGEKGDGICKKSGFVLFVPNTREGDNVRIRITKVLNKVGFAEVVGEASAAPAESAQEEPAQEEAPEEEFPEGEATEDFGEEPVAEEEAPAEETSEETPAKETVEVSEEEKEELEEMDEPPKPEE